MFPAKKLLLLLFSFKYYAGEWAFLYVALKLLYAKLILAIYLCTYTKMKRFGKGTESQLGTYISTTSLIHAC